MHVNIERCRRCHYTCTVWGRQLASGRHQSRNRSNVPFFAFHVTRCLPRTVSGCCPSRGSIENGLIESVGTTSRTSLEVATGHAVSILRPYKLENENAVEEHGLSSMSGERLLKSE